MRIYNKFYNFIAESKVSERCSFNIIIKRFITIIIFTCYIITCSEFYIFLWCNFFTSSIKQVNYLCCIACPRFLEDKPTTKSMKILLASDYKQYNHNILIVLSQMRSERLFDLVMELYYFLLKVAQKLIQSILALSNTSKSEIHF